MRVLTIVILSFLSLPSHALAKSFGDYKGAVYLRNYDGDTITFNLPGLHPIIGEEISIRVNGIDTPEIKGKARRKSTMLNRRSRWSLIFSRMRNRLF